MEECDMNRSITKRIVFVIALALSSFAVGESASDIAPKQGLAESELSNTAWPAAQQQQNPANPQDKPAEEVYKNIQVLKGIPASRLMGAMNFFARSLGVKCNHCHILNEFDKDEKPTKLTARKMYQLVQLTHKSLGNTRVSCFMCHRGKAVPEPMPAEVKAEVDELIKDGEKDTRPAEKVFKNIQRLKGVPAGRIMGIMTMFSKSLGVECSFCHDETAFEKDDNEHKQKARQMMSMVGSIAREIYQGPTTINCYTCHRGQAEPVSMPQRPETPKQETQKKDGN
jgi:Photosynthetic reaction centre cytochrome C subunit